MGETEIRILVVEDNEGHAGLIRRAFSKASMATRLTLVDSVREASEFLGREGIDLVLADLVLPDGRGTELLPSRAEQDWPVVIMTSHGDETAAVEAMKAGALDYIVKSQTAWPVYRVPAKASCVDGTISYNAVRPCELCERVRNGFVCSTKPPHCPISP